MRLSLLVAVLVTAGTTANAQPAFWSPTKGPYGGSVAAVVVTNTGTLLAATLHGLFRSTNDGASWNPTAPELRVDEVAGLATTGTGTVIATSLYRYLRSTDDGLTWTTPPGATKPYHVANGPGDVLFGLVSGFDPALCRSTDGGITWHSSMAAYDIRVVRSDFVIIVTGYGVQLSRDSGRTWSDAALPVYPTAAATRRDNALIIAGVDTSSARRVALSTDDGITWRDMSLGLDGRDVQSLVADSRDRILAIVENGVLRWDESARRWSIISSFPMYPHFGSGEHVQLAVSKVAGSIHSPSAAGHVRSTDDGVTWSYASQGMNAQEVRCIQSLNNGVILAGTSSDIFRSTDLGQTWKPTGGRSGAIAIAAAQNDVLIAEGRDRLRRSTDLGITWTDIRSGVSVYNIVATSTGFVAAAIADSGSCFITTSADNGVTWQDAPYDWLDPNTLAVGPCGDLVSATANRVRRSSDRGISWRDVVTAPENVRSILPLRNGGMLIGTRFGSVFLFDSAAGTLVHSGALDTTFIVDLKVDRDQNEYAISTARVFMRTVATPDIWQDISSGIEVPVLSRLSVHPSGHLFLGTVGGGVQQSARQITGVDEQEQRPLELDLSILKR